MLGSVDLLPAGTTDRRELVGTDLVNQNRFGQVSQVMMAQREHFLVNHLGHVARKENLTTNCAVFESARPVGDRSKVIASAMYGVASMKSYTDSQARAVPPICSSEIILDGDGCVNRCLGILERCPKVIARPPEQEPTCVVNDASDQFVVDFHAFVCGDCVLLPNTGRPLDICKHKRDDPFRVRITIPGEAHSLRFPAINGPWKSTYSSLTHSFSSHSTLTFDIRSGSPGIQFGFFLADTQPNTTRTLSFARCLRCWFDAWVDGWSQ